MAKTLRELRAELERLKSERSGSAPVPKGSKAASPSTLQECDDLLRLAVQREVEGRISEAIQALERARGLAAQIPSEQNLWSSVSANITRLLEKRVDQTLALTTDCVGAGPHSGMSGKELGKVSDKSGRIVGTIYGYANVNTHWLKWHAEGTPEDDRTELGDTGFAGCGTFTKNVAPYIFEVEAKTAERRKTDAGYEFSSIVTWTVRIKN
ncbi:MAG: hypothetical protein HYY18_10595 [Planctomycetes bacterium]|nr:hypothetical protein [Planctomycetota bacterium]